MQLFVYAKSCDVMMMRATLLCLRVVHSFIGYDVVGQSVVVKLVGCRVMMLLSYELCCDVVMYAKLC